MAIGKWGAFAILAHLIRIFFLLLACFALAPAAAQALPKPPPVKDGVSCHLVLKKTYPVAKVARSGLPYSHEVRLPGAGSASQRGKLLKVARRIVQRHKRTRILVTLAVEREDGYLWSEPALNRRITLVR
jgi:hypothetical protein